LEKRLVDGAAKMSPKWPESNGKVLLSQDQVEELEEIVAEITRVITEGISPNGYKVI
jgi:hypothetical protein